MGGTTSHGAGGTHSKVSRRTFLRGGALGIAGVLGGAPASWAARELSLLTAVNYAPASDAKLDELLDGMSRVEFMLRFTLSHPDLDTTIVGTANVDHFRDNLAAAVKGPLPDDVVNEAKQRLDAAGASSAG